MVRKEVLDYIKDAKARGMNTVQIRAALLRAGHPAAEVQQALSARVITTKTLLIIAVALAVLILLVLVCMKLFAEPKQIELLVTVQQPAAEPGQEIAATAVLTSEQSKKTTVRLVFELFHEDSGKTISSRFVRKEVGKSAVITEKLVIPPNAPKGTYTINVQAKYCSKDAQGSQSFSVVLPEEAEEPEEEKTEFLKTELAECPETCDDFNPCTEDYCEQGICKHDLLDNCCGNNKCEPGENALTCPEDCARRDLELADVIDKAKKTATESAEKAAVMCNSIGLEADRDACFVEIAKISKKSALCHPISDSRTRDTCYMDFAFELKDFSVCESISNRYMLTSCLSYANAQQPIPTEDETKQMAEEAVVSDEEV